MPIQVPKISVDPNVEQQHAPRVEMQAPDAVTPMKQDTGAIEGVAKDVIRLHNEIQHQQADNTATDKYIEHQVWVKKRIYGDPETNWVGYANMKGVDPQKLYKQFDEENTKKLNELSTPGDGENWSTETQNLVNRRLARSFRETELTTGTQYGHQKMQYDATQRQSMVGLGQQGMFQSSGLIVPGDDSSFGPMKKEVMKVRDASISYALAHGGAVYDDQAGETLYNDGSGPRGVNLTPATKFQIAKDISKGLSDTTKNLLDSGDVDRATALRDWALENKYIDNFSMGKLNDKLQRKKFAHDAAGLAEDALRSGKGVGALDAIEDPELRQKARSVYSQQEHILESDSKRKSKDAYNNVMDHLLKVQRSDNPYVTSLQLENDPIFQKSIDNVKDPKLKQAIYNAVESPKTSTPQSVDRVVNLFTKGTNDGRGAWELSDNELQAQMSGLSKADKTHYQREWEKLKNPSNASVRAMYSQVGKEMDGQAVGMGLLHKVPNSQNFAFEDDAKEKMWKSELIRSLADQPPMRAQEVSPYVAKFLAAKKAGEQFAPPSRQKFNGGGSAPPPTAVFGNMNEANKMLWVQKYRKDHADPTTGKLGPVPSPDQLNKFIEDATKGH